MKNLLKILTSKFSQILLFKGTFNTIGNYPLITSNAVTAERLSTQGGHVERQFDCRIIELVDFMETRLSIRQVINILAHTVIQMLSIQ